MLPGITPSMPQGTAAVLPSSRSFLLAQASPVVVGSMMVVTSCMLVIGKLTTRCHPMRRAGKGEGLGALVWRPVLGRYCCDHESMRDIMMQA